MGDVRNHRRSALLATAAVVVLALLAVPSPARADIELVEQCESATGAVWWNSALYRDADSDLFQQENFPDVGVWPSEGDLSPGVRDCFGTGTPHSRNLLLHWVLARPEGAAFTQPHPILLVPGAGDNGKRVFTFMAYALAFEGYNVFSLTFAQPNGDNYQHAEQIANTIEVISDLYGGSKVDVVAHSMGGVATWIYAANDGNVEWGSGGDARGTRYAGSGTRYRGDIRRLHLLGTPMRGVDTAFRWSNVNYTRVLETPLNAPITWDTYYPLTTVNLLVTEDLIDYGYFSPSDFFPGQAQTLARLDDVHDLPGSVSALGGMALQQDWLTTYEGGLGFYSSSRGIDEAIEVGGGVMAKLSGAGIDPEIELFVAAGLNPILPLEYGALFVDEDQREQYGDWMESDWPRLTREWLDPNMPHHPTWSYDLPGVFEGRSVVGELSGPSDGIVFSASATHTEPLLQRGAELKEVRTFEALNHLELTYAGRLASFFFGDQETSGDLYDPNASEKYDAPDNQIVEWIDGNLHVDPPDDVTPDAGMSDASMSDAGGDDSGGEEADADPGEDTAPDAMSPDAVEADVPGDEDTADTADAADDETGEPQGPATVGGRAREGCSVGAPSPGLIRSPLGAWSAMAVVLIGVAMIYRRR